MEIRFLGGAGEVGRSGILLKDSKTILLDYGIKVDGHTEYPEKAGRVDACIVSHAHLDHSGFSPSLYHEGFPFTVATEPTMKLAELLIKDSMKIHRKKHEHEHFHKAQLHAMMNRYLPLPYSQTTEFDRYDISLHNAGHICGSAVSLIEKKASGRRLVYTGDFKMEPQLLEKGAEVVKSNILILESTYANKDHPDREGLIQRMVDEMWETVDNGGTALLPAFAVGRSQELLAILQRSGLIKRTFIDGMARAATDIVAGYPDYVSDRSLLENAIRNSVWVDSRRKKMEAVDGGNVIVTTSGMLNGGPVLDYITRLNRESRIFITGFQVEGTNGNKMIQGRPIDIDGRDYRVRTPFSVYDLSAHAGKKDIHEYVKRSCPETVVCVHGSEENTSILAEDLRAKGFDAYAPRVGDSISVEF